MRRRAERVAELAAEVPRREPRGTREHAHVELLTVARVDQVLGAQEVAGGGNGRRCNEQANVSRSLSVFAILVRPWLSAARRNARYADMP